MPYIVLHTKALARKEQVLRPLEAANPDQKSLTNPVAAMEALQARIQRPQTRPQRASSPKGRTRF